jgi:hypothetical protein
MKLQTITAHYDGKNICLDEPIDLTPDAKLLITVLSEKLEVDGSNWETLSMISLERSYGEDEPEYTIAVIKEPNPGYLK